MKMDYTKKDISKSASTKGVDQTSEKESSSPIFKKRQHWCFKKDGTTHKFDSKSEAEKALEE